MRRRHRGVRCRRANGVVAAARRRGVARELLPAQGLPRLLQHQGRARVGGRACRTQVLARAGRAPGAMGAARGARSVHAVPQQRQLAPESQLDDGRLLIGELVFRLDTRNNVGDPWTGWLIDASLETGGANHLTVGPTSFDVRMTVRFGRACALQPAVRGHAALQSHVAAVAAQFPARARRGFGDDSLPLERRFALGGAGTLPGYDFRAPYHGPDVLSCNRGPAAIPGQPALCDRMLLGQIGVSPRLAHPSLRPARRRWRAALSRGPDVAFVAFADGGRGWISGSRFGDLRYPSGSIPSLSTFKYDAGGRRRPALRWASTWRSRSRTGATRRNSSCACGTASSVRILLRALLVFIAHCTRRSRASSSAGANARGGEPHDRARRTARCATRAEHAHLFGPRRSRDAAQRIPGAIALSPRAVGRGGFFDDLKRQVRMGRDRALQSAQAPLHGHPHRGRSHHRARQLRQSRPYGGTAVTSDAARDRACPMDTTSTTTTSCSTCRCSP